MWPLNAIINQQRKSHWNPHFPMVFLCFPMVFPCFPMVFLWFSYGLGWWTPHWCWWNHQGHLCGSAQRRQRRTRPWRSTRSTAPSQRRSRRGSVSGPGQSMGKSVKIILLVLNAGNFREWSTFANYQADHPSNPQQPIHSLLSTSKSWNILEH